jgi:hypothetical protein
LTLNIFFFQPRTPLEEEIASVLQNSSQMLEREDKELSLEEEEALKNMSLEEVCALNTSSNTG